LTVNFKNQKYSENQLLNRESYVKIPSKIDLMEYQNCFNCSKWLNGDIKACVTCMTAIHSHCFANLNCLSCGSPQQSAMTSNICLSAQQISLFPKMKKPILAKVMNIATKMNSFLFDASKKMLTTL